MQVHAHAKLVIRLRLGADHRRQVEDYVGIGRDRFARQIGNVTAQPTNRKFGVGLTGDVDKVERHQAGDFVPAKPTVVGQMGSELAAQEAGAAQDGDLHGHPFEAMSDGGLTLG